jgi:hypothetical protein
MKKVHLLDIFMLTAFCVGCSSVQVKSPAELNKEKTANYSLILLRLSAEVNGKPIDVINPPIFGGYSNAYTLTLSNLATGEEPEKIYPRTDRVAALSVETKNQGWIYFFAPAGDYDLEVTIQASSQPLGAKSPIKHFVLHIGQNAKIIYGGTLIEKCHGTTFLMLANCEGVETPIDETLAAKVIAQTFFTNSKPIVTELLRPLINWSVADLQPIGLVIQQKGKLVTPPWIRRGMSLFTGIGDPGKAYTSSSPPSYGLSICGQACATLYIMYIPAGTLLGAGYGAYTEAKWQPCIASMQQEIAHFDFSAKLGNAIIQAFQATKKLAPVNLSHAHNPMEEASHLGLKSIIKADIQRIQLRECWKDGTFCIEFALHFTVNDIKSGQVLYGETVIYSESDASIQDRPYEIGTHKKPTCYSMNSYCGVDKTVFQYQFKEAIDVLANEILHSFKGQKSKTVSGN